MNTASVSISRVLAAFATQSRREICPASARHILKLSLLDWCAVAIAGRDEPVSRIVRDMVAQEGGAEDAHVFGCERKLPPRAAALANGAISHALDYDDTHFDYIGHPSVAVTPAALALAEQHDASGRDFLDALLVGVESACRIGAWLGAAHYRHGFHQTATSGAFGATLAAARLLGLKEDRIRHALAIATTRASGLKSQFGTMGKPYNAGVAASNGVEAAQLASRGFESNTDAVEGPQGFGPTHAGAANAVEMVLAGVGETYRFEFVQHKFHACCHGLHAALEALIEARDTYRLAPADIRGVTIFVHPHWLKVCDIHAPKTGLEAKFSYRLTAAMVLAGRATGALPTYSDAICRDPALVELRDIVRADGDASLNDTSARVIIERASGARVEAFHDLDRPMPAAAREQKVRAKAAALLGAARANALWEAIGALEANSARQFAASLFQ